MPTLEKRQNSTGDAQNHGEKILEQENQVKSAHSSPKKIVTKDDENRSPERSQPNNITKPNVPKRILRDRKPRTTLNNESVGKCHI